MSEAPERICVVNCGKPPHECECMKGYGPDLCDPLSDPRVSALVEAAKSLRDLAQQNTDDALEWEGAINALDAARAALSQPE